MTKRGWRGGASCFALWNPEPEPRSGVLAGVAAAARRDQNSAGASMRVAGKDGRCFIEPRTAPQQQSSFALAKGSQGWLRADVIENDPGEGSCRFWAFQR